VARCAGEAGAQLSRRDYGETVLDLNKRFPYQFARNYQKYGEHVDQMPFDAHILVALVAPRPLYLNTGSEDRWSDPKGEFLAAVAADPVYRLLGKNGLGTTAMPAASQLVGDTVAYRMHAGGHGTLPGDWEYFLSFMEKHLTPRR